MSMKVQLVLEKVVKRFEVHAKEHNQTLEWVDCSEEGATLVRSTSDDLDRVFTNLISNAIKYNRPQGKVTITLERDGTQALISVADTGIGIPDDALPSLFEEFYRAPNAKAIERQGTGLGLAIARQIITRTGGHITVQSRLDEGTTFTVILPVV